MFVVKSIWEAHYTQLGRVTTHISIFSTPSIMKRAELCLIQCFSDQLDHRTLFFNQTVRRIKKIGHAATYLLLVDEMKHFLWSFQRTVPQSVPAALLSDRSFFWNSVCIIACLGSLCKEIGIVSVWMLCFSLGIFFDYMSMELYQPYSPFTSFWPSTLCYWD